MGHPLSISNLGISHSQRTFCALAHFVTHFACSKSCHILHNSFGRFWSHFVSQHHSLPALIQHTYISYTFSHISAALHMSLMCRVCHLCHVLDHFYLMCCTRKEALFNLVAHTSVFSVYLTHIATSSDIYVISHVL